MLLSCTRPDCTVQFDSNFNGCPACGQFGRPQVYQDLDETLGKSDIQITVSLATGLIACLCYICMFSGIPTDEFDQFDGEPKYNFSFAYICGFMFFAWVRQSCSILTIQNHKSEEKTAGKWKGITVFDLATWAIWAFDFSDLHFDTGGGAYMAFLFIPTLFLFPIYVLANFGQFCVLAERIGEESFLVIWKLESVLISMAAVLFATFVVTYEFPSLFVAIAVSLIFRLSLQRQISVLLCWLAISKDPVCREEPQRLLIKTTSP